MVVIYAAANSLVNCIAVFQKFAKRRKEEEKDRGGANTKEREREGGKDRRFDRNEYIFISPKEINAYRKKEREKEIERQILGKKKRERIFDPKERDKKGIRNTKYKTCEDRP